MKKLIYVALALCLVCVAFADDYIIQFRLWGGQHVSFRTADVSRIGYDYHDQDSIDQAYRDSVRAEFVRDSLYKDSLYRDELMRDSLGAIQTLGYMLDSAAHYTIFVQALKLTGLYDTLNVVRIREFGSDYDHKDTSYGNMLLYGPTKSRNGFTVFAEPDSVMQANGIGSIADLIQYANNQYGNAAEWYDYLGEKGLKVSTADDYTSEQNALHMLMAYHILPSKMAVEDLVYERNTKWWGQVQTWNYVNGGQPYDYFETLLPQTLLKVWQPGAPTNNSIYINRYIANNTLTDEVASMGSSEMHPLLQGGAMVTRENGYGYNGYYHPIDRMLVYDRTVPQGVLHERMRFDFASMLPEMNNNGFRFMTSKQAADLNDGGSGIRLAFPNDYFEGIRVYLSSTCLRYNVKGAYNTYMSDCMQGWGYYDLAVRLPALPTGRYEVRISHVPMSHGGQMEYAFLPDPDATEGWDDQKGKTVIAGEVVIDSVDLTIPYDDPRIGLTSYLDEEDLGIASDRALRERGYMRGPFSYRDHPERDSDDPLIYNQRSSLRNPGMRKILGRFEFKQGQDRWLRVRSLSPDETDLKFILDYIEFVPVDVVDNAQYMEDWY